MDLTGLLLKFIRGLNDMKFHDQIGSIFWISIGLFTAVTAYRLGLGSFEQPGPGFIFFGASSLLTILGVVDLRQGILRVRNPEQKEEPLWSGFRWHKVLVVMAGLCAFTYFLQVLGFFLATFLIMIFLFKAVEPTRWLKALCGSLLTTLIVYLIFKTWLQVPFPVGPWGF